MIMRQIMMINECCFMNECNDTEVWLRMSKSFRDSVWYNKDLRFFVVFWCGIYCSFSVLFCLFMWVFFPTKGCKYNHLITTFYFKIISFSFFSSSEHRSCNLQISALALLRSLLFSSKLTHLNIMPHGF